MKKILCFSLIGLFCFACKKIVTPKGVYEPYAKPVDQGKVISESLPESMPLPVSIGEKFPESNQSEPKPSLKNPESQLSREENKIPESQHSLDGKSKTSDTVKTESRPDSW